jgi:hypothetical protein
MRALQVYHPIVDKLKVLDRGDGEPWNPPIPMMSEHCTYLPGTSPKKRAKNAVDITFNNFGKLQQMIQAQHHWCPVVIS